MKAESLRGFATESFYVSLLATLLWTLSASLQQSSQWPALANVGPVISSGFKTPVAGREAQVGWEEHFNGPGLDKSRWVIANELAPGRILNNHLGVFQSDRVSVVGGYLVLRLTQEPGRVGGNSGGVISRGGLVRTTKTFGYGTYQIRMRMSSSASSAEGHWKASISGSVSAGFLYVNNSVTETDIEARGDRQNAIYFTTWKNPNPNSDPRPGDSTTSSVPLFGMTDGFKTYKFVWTKADVSYYVDDVLQARHTTVVPTTPAQFMISHRGTNSPHWGGLATVGETRYFLVDWVKYSPAN